MIVDITHVPGLEWTPRRAQRRCRPLKAQFWIMHCHDEVVVEKNMASKANYLDAWDPDYLQQALLGAM